MTDHQPSPSAISECAKAVDLHMEDTAIDFDPTPESIAEAVLRCAVEEGYYIARHGLDDIDTCPTWYDGCQCDLDTLTFHCQRANKAEAECATLRARSPTHELGYALTCAEKERDRWKERAEHAEKHIASARSMLRIECEEIDANDWDDSLHLSDVIEKHLCRKYHHDIERAERERDSAAEHLRATVKERDRLKAALNEIASWREGDVGGHMDEPGSAQAARDALGKS